jgi:hypothetical protein
MTGCRILHLFSKRLKKKSSTVSYTIKYKSESSSSKRRRQFFKGLSIRQKIVTGYTLSLGIGVLGTTGGLLIGDRYFPGARDNMLLADQEKAGLSSLQGLLLQIQVHQQ